MLPSAAPMKPKPLTEAQFLAYLEKALSQVLPDLKLRAAVHEAVAKEIRLHNNVASFTKFAEKGSVPDLNPETVAELQEQIASTFGSDANVAVTPDEEGKGVGIEITLPDRTISSEIKVQPAGGPGDDDGQPKAPFVPFPVTLAHDPELVWVFARREDLGPRRGRAGARAHRGTILGIQERAEVSAGGRREILRGIHRQRPGGSVAGKRLETSLQGAGSDPLLAASPDRVQTGGGCVCRGKSEFLKHISIAFINDGMSGFAP